MKYRSEIDGLRALAVIPVIFFHAGFEVFSGGFIGVDVFFVISGYLITSVLLNDLKMGNFSIVNFYERRARRILPALFVVMLICMPFVWLWLLPQSVKSFSQSLVAVSVFASNILFWKTSDYFAASTELQPLIHTWSLSVEEQFYAIFPLLLLFTWRLGLRWKVVILVKVIILSLGLAQWGAFAKPALTFYMLPSRAWELLIGVSVAVYYSEYDIKKHKYWISELGSLLGFALILYATFTYSHQTPFPSLYALVPTIGAALVIIFATNKTIVGKLLSTKLFLYVGLISYSTYLWHQPLFAFARLRSIEPPSQELFIALIIITLPLAHLTWRFVEQPFRNKNLISRKTFFIIFFCLSISFISIGLFGHITKGYFNRGIYTTIFKDLENITRVNFGLSDICEDEYTESEKCRTGANPTIIVWGDSYAMHLVDGIIASNPNVQLIQATISNCGPFFGVAPYSPPNYGVEWGVKCIESNDRVKELLKNKTSLKYAVLSSPFDGYVGEGAQILTRDGKLISGEQNSYTYFEKTLEEIKSHGIKPIVVSPTPKNGNNIGDCLLKASLFNVEKSRCNFQLAISEQRNQKVNELLRKVELNYNVIWLSNGVCPDGTCNVFMDKVFIYRDGGHLSHDGSAFIGKKMDFYHLITRQ
jgi:peptidoglycan/LPS O-acetylase OafA/YrhL